MNEVDEVVPPDWAMAAARRWTDNMVVGMRRVGLQCADPSERMYLVGAKIIMQEMPIELLDATERREAMQEVFAAAHALLIPFEGARWSGPPQTLEMALDRLRAAVAKAEGGA